jgi:CBF/Mak21 family
LQEHGARDAAELEASVLMATAAFTMLGELKVGDAARLAAFVKRLASSALHVPPGAALAQLSVANRLLRRHARLRGLLEGESVGSLGAGGYNPFTADPAEAGALSCTAWELALLPQHFHSDVAQSAIAVAQIPPGGGSGNLSGVVNTAATPQQLAEAYAFERTGVLKPAPEAAAPPRKVAARTHRRGDVSGACLAQLAAYEAGMPVDEGATARASSAGAGAQQLQDADTDSVARELQALFECAPTHSVRWCSQASHNFCWAASFRAGGQVMIPKAARAALCCCSRRPSRKLYQYVIVTLMPSSSHNGIYALNVSLLPADKL